MTWKMKTSEIFGEDITREQRRHVYIKDSCLGVSDQRKPGSMKEKRE